MRREHSFLAAVASNFWSVGPVDLFRLFRLFRDEPGDRLAPLGDDDFLPRTDPTQKAGIMVAQITDTRCSHVATLM